MTHKKVTHINVDQINNAKLEYNINYRMQVDTESQPNQMILGQMHHN